MNIEDKLEAAFAQVSDEWNKAEKAIKLAEQVNGEIVNPAIYELRYAGRRLVEAIQLVNSDKKTSIERLKDAHFDCCRARHDALDAATSYMTDVLDLAAMNLGADVVIDRFPKITEVVYLLAKVREKVAKSREEREDRDVIYATIERDNLSEIIPLYEEFKASEPLLMAAAAKNRRALFTSRLFGWGGLIIGIIGIIIGFL